MILKKTGTFISKLLAAYSEDNISILSAALAYYTVFSLAPLLIICIALAGVFLGTEEAHQQVMLATSKFINVETASQIQTMVEQVHKPANLGITGFISIAVLLFGALGVFNAMQQGLNLVWGVRTDPHRPWSKLLCDRFFSFTMVLIIAFLLLVFLILSVTLTAVSSYLSHIFGVFVLIGLGLNYLLSFLIITLLFALIFKILPDVVMHWKEVWSGAFITALLFTLGKLLLGLYFSYVPVATAFGAAGSLIVILIWVYYSSQIFFIGAEITKLFAAKHSKKIITTHDSIIT